MRSVRACQRPISLAHKLLTHWLAQALEGPGEEVLWVAWHPKGQVVLAGSADFTAWMWLAQTGACMQVCVARAGREGGRPPAASARVWG